MEISSVFFWMQKLLSVSLVIHGVEYFWIHHQFAKNSFNKFLNIVQVGLAITFFFHLDIYLISVLLFLSFYMSRSFRGFFNGGSDSMTLLTIVSLWGFLFFQNISHSLSQFFVYYLAIQVSLSYFISGYVKIKEPQWRNGEALQLFLNFNAYGPMSFSFLKKPKVYTNLSWVVILMELMFPLALLNANILVLFLCFFAVFHLINIYVFGLNRFFYAWIATYPALIYLSDQITQIF